MSHNKIAKLLNVFVAVSMDKLKNIAVKTKGVRDDLSMLDKVNLPTYREFERGERIVIRDGRVLLSYQGM